MKLDPFTSRRIIRLINEFREKNGQLPSLQDFEASGIAKEMVESAVSDKIIEKFYVTLTNGTIIKGFKVVQT